MKRMLQRKERPAMHKTGLTQKRRYSKRINKYFKKRYKQISAPHNTSEYLMENNSSPFYEDEDADLIPTSLIILEDSEELFDDDSIFQSKNSSTSTLGESIGIDSHLAKKTSIFTLK